MLDLEQSREMILSNKREAEKKLAESMDILRRITDPAETVEAARVAALRGKKVNTLTFLTDLLDEDGVEVDDILICLSGWQGLDPAFSLCLIREIVAPSGRAAPAHQESP